MGLGKVWLVGAGPGAPDLLTLRAARLIASADIVLHDALVHPDTVALATRAQIFAVGKRCGGQATAQRFINRRLVEAARRHGCVVRLKGGDPMVFGRACEEIAALRAAGIEFEVVPGITAALAAAAALGVSLTERGVSRSLALATPRRAEGTSGADWAAAFARADTGALYMAARDAAGVRDALMAQGCPPDWPVAVCSGVSLPYARTAIGTLAELGRLTAGTHDAPTVLLFGDVLRQRESAGTVRCTPTARERARA